MNVIFAKRTSLHTRILSFSILITALMTIGIGTFTYFLSTEVIKADAQEKLFAIARVKEGNLNRWVDEQKRYVVFISSLAEMRLQAGNLTGSASSPEQRQQARQTLVAALRDIITTTADSQEIFLLNHDGVIIVSSSPEHIGLDLSGQSYFKQSLNSTTVTSFYHPDMLETATMTVATPMFDTRGQRVGVLASHLSLAQVDRIIREHTGLGDTSEIYLVNAARQLVSVDPLASQTDMQLSSVGINAALEKKDATGLYKNYRGDNVIGAFVWDEERDVAVIVEISQDEALGSTRVLGRSVILMGIVALAITSVVFYLLARRLIHPIEALTQTATEIAAGKTNLRALVNTNDEVGQLAMAFNSMTDELHQTMLGLENLNEQLEARVESRTAELQASNRELEAFSYSVSHDLRAPLRAVNGFSRIILDDHSQELSADVLNRVVRINENAVQMGRLIEGLLSLSSLGRKDIQPQQISAAELTAMIQKISDTLRTEPGYGHISTCIENLQPCYADSTLLNQVFTNLLSNAFKFSSTNPAGHVEVGSVETEDGYLYYVRDNGAGFDMNNAKKLFGVFQRFHRKDEFDGTGVGLAIVQRIIHRHRGEIWASSSPGNGAVFYFTVKLEK